MAGLNFDFSSYPKPTQPKSLMDNLKDINTVESQEIAIDKQKLDLLHQRFGHLAQGLTQLSADPNLNEDKIRKYATDMVKLGYVPNDMAAKFISTLTPTQGMPPTQAAAALKQNLLGIMQQIQTNQEAIGLHYGGVRDLDDSSATYTGIQRSPVQGGQFVPTTVTPHQLPPTTPQVNNDPSSPDYLQPGYVGPSGRAGPRPLSKSVAPPLPDNMVSDPSQGNLTSRSPPTPARTLRNTVTGPTGPTIRRFDLEDNVEKPASFNDRFGSAFPNRVATGASPGVAAAIETVGAQSGKDYASSLNRARNFQADLYPAEASLKALRELGPQAIGPGTDQFNDLKRAFVTWLPNIDPKTIEEVSNFDQLKKYLTQTARSSGNTGTNDQLAAAFDANPNTKMSTAGVDTVLKSIIALRKMEHAQTLLFGEQGLPPNQYSKWIAKNQNIFDPRAFGFADMDRKAQEKVIKSLTPSQRKKFEYSLEFATQAGLIEPPKLKR